MDRVQIAAIAVAVALMVASFLFAPAPPPADPSAVEPKSAAEVPPTAPTSEGQAAPPAPVERPLDEVKAKIVTLENDAVRVSVSNLGGRLEGVQLLKYRATVEKGSGPVDARTGANFLGEIGGDSRNARFGDLSQGRQAIQTLIHEHLRAGVQIRIHQLNRLNLFESLFLDEDTQKSQFGKPFDEILIENLSAPAAVLHVSQSHVVPATCQVPILQGNSSASGESLPLRTILS